MLSLSFDMIVAEILPAVTQYLNRDLPPLKTKQLRPHVDPIATYIHEQFHPFDKESV